MASLFARVRGKGWGGEINSGDGDRIIFVADSGELFQPRTGHPQRPRPLDGKAVAFDSRTDRREALADWLTDPKNPYFSRAITNRVWANFMGPGLVEAVDDMRLTNPASNPPLLTALADDLVHSGFNLKALMRRILTSAAYQRSSATVRGNEGDERFYSRFYARRLKAEVLLDAVSQVTEAPTTFNGHSKGTRALQLVDAATDSYFLNVFGRPERLITCECERSNEPSMSQVLHIANGDTLNSKIEAQHNRIERLLQTHADDRAIVEDLYLAALARKPLPDEEGRLTAALADVETSDRQAPLVSLQKNIGEALAIPDAARRKDALARLDAAMKEIPEKAAATRRKAIEDLYWSVLSSKEFLFNH
jgi:hypothetical protein